MRGRDVFDAADRLVLGASCGAGGQVDPDADIARDDQGVVVAPASKDAVRPFTTEQSIISTASSDRVVTRSRVEVVVPVTALEPVVAAAGIDVVATFRSRDAVVVSRAEDVLDTAHEIYA